MANGNVPCPSVFCSTKTTTVSISGTVKPWSVNPQVPDGYKIIAVTIKNGYSAETTIGIEVLTNSEISGYIRKVTTGTNSCNIEILTLAIPEEE